MSKNVILEDIKNTSRFKNYEPLNNFIDKNIENVLKKIDAMMIKFGEKFPDSSSIKGIYKIIENDEWTTSFWTGMLWLAYEYTGSNKYKALALKNLESFKNRIERKGKDVQNHDLGFMYTLSAVATYKITGNEESKHIAKEAADFLITRYLEKAKIIQAWGDLNDPKEQGRMIIDCNMNLPLLYFISEVFKDDKYKDIAFKHVKQAEKYIVREDASTFHTYYMDVVTGEAKYGKTSQGAGDNSCWARGQAWAVYGFMLSYKYTKQKSFLELSQKLANYFLNRLPEDNICYWDLSFPLNSKEPRDSSSNAILICGLLEMLKHLPITDEYSNLYKDVVYSMMYNLDKNYVSYNSQEDGILKHSCYAVPQGRGVDEFCIWGDYFYFESLIRLKTTWEPYW